MAHKVGIDIGNSSIKYYSDFGFGEIPTWRARGQITQVVADSHAPLSAIRYNGEDLILGEDAVLGTNFVWKTDEEKGDDVNVPFILLALARMGITQADIVLGLPVSTASSKRKVEKAKETYSGVKEAVINGRNITYFLKANVMAEPLGTYLSLVLDENFRYVKTSPYFHDQLAIVDIGYRTVDIVILERGKLATTQNSTMSGMIRLFDKIKADLEAEHGKMRPNEEVRIHGSIINHFGTGMLKINGEHVRPDFWKRAAQYKGQIARDILDEIKVVLSEIRPDRILLTGGGALLLQNELLNGNRHFVMHNNPRFANVLGFYRAAKTMTEQPGAGGPHADHRDHIAATQSR